RGVPIVMSESSTRELSNSPLCRTRARRIQNALALIPPLAVVAALLAPAEVGAANTLHAVLAHWTFMAQTFLFHLAAACAVICIIAVWRRERSIAAVLAVAAISGFGPAIAAYIPRRPPPVGPTVRVMSANLFCGTADPNSIAELARTESPDLICFEE